MVAGKGGVGKTTVSAALVELALRRGMRALLVAVEGPRDRAGDGLPPGAWRAITPDDALADYLADHGLGRLSRRLASSGAVDVVATAAPGIRDLLVLGKIKQLERSGTHDLIVVDAPAAGHAVSFLTAPAGLAELVGTGPVRAQADDVLAMLGDPVRCSVLLVTLPEELSVNEAAETAFHLEDRAGVKLGPVVVNAVQDEVAALRRSPAEAAAEVGTGAAAVSPADVERLAAAAASTRSEAARHARQLERLARRLPLPQVVLPRVPAGSGSPAGHLAGRLEAAIGAVRPGPGTGRDPLGGGQG
jgi:anion-transporting  ArsA/GET3 family ATPase